MPESTKASTQTRDVTVVGRFRNTDRRGRTGKFVFGHDILENFRESSEGVRGAVLEIFLELFTNGRTVSVKFGEVKVRTPEEIRGRGGEGRKRNGDRDRVMIGGQWRG